MWEKSTIDPAGHNISTFVTDAQGLNCRAVIHFKGLPVLS